MAEEAPGSEVAADHLAEVLFIQTLRAHIASGSEDCKRVWLRAIFNPQIGAALRSIHGNVNSPLTVESLSAATGMSRSAFASRFKEIARTDTARLRNRVENAEGDAIATECRQETDGDRALCWLRIGCRLQQTF